jgi:hypothetical protein
MRLSQGLWLGGLGLGAIGAALGFGCSSSSSGGGGNGPTGDTCTSPGVTCITPPPAPTTSTANTSKHNYAVNKLYIGDTDRQGVKNKSAWKDYGFDLDGLVTTKDSTDVCSNSVMGWIKENQADGTSGIDNSFGKNILDQVITLAGSDTAGKINAAITNGTFTVMAYVTGFDDTAPQTASGLKGVLLAGGDYTTLEAGAPKFDMSTHWPIRADLLTCGPTCPAGSDPVATSKVQFPSAYQVAKTFVNGSASDVQLSLSIGGQSLNVTVHSALITFDQAGPGKVTNGTIAGVIKTSELVTSITQIAGHISTGLCSGSTLMQIQAIIQQASDIFINGDGSVSNKAGEECNGISIGLGFEGSEIAPPASADIAAPSAPSPDPCAVMDGGSD